MDPPVTKQLVTHVRMEGLALVQDVGLISNYNTGTQCTVKVQNKLRVYSMCKLEVYYIISIPITHQLRTPIPTAHPFQLHTHSNRTPMMHTHSNSTPIMHTNSNYTPIMHTHSNCTPIPITHQFQLHTNYAHPFQFHNSKIPIPIINFILK